MSPDIRSPLDLRTLVPERWARISAILDQALDLHPDQLAAHLDQSCAGDPVLRAQVEDLLAADQAAEDFLSGIACRGALLEEIAHDLARPEAGVPMEGRSIGAWRLVRELGRGGMGAVYLAERGDGSFDQKVALKLLKRGLDSDEILQRFLRERRILARLEHRHIARLVDGGISEDGLPWFAMEYVEGQPITRWCEERQAGLEERLRLFRNVCEAVQYAHRNLVIHRDLKPSNIFVAAGGEVKLLDFGIARLLGDEAGGEATLTGAAGAMLTPHYAAPEQLRGDATTTATDIYSLGVVLYELLTGRRPHASATGFDALRKAVLEQEPPPPSQVAAQGARLLRGDLDHIVGMALRIEPRRRYSSVEALEADLERWRDRRPVLATPPSPGYRIGKFLGRNRVLVGAAAAVTAVVGIAILATMWQVVAGVVVVAALAGGLAVALGQARAARLEARKAEEVRRFLVRVFQVSDPSESRGKTVTARELLDQGARRIDDELRGQPALRAEMLGVLGDLHIQLGSFESGLPLVERELELLPARAGARADALRRRGHLLVLKGDWESAEQTLRQAAALHRRARGESSLEYAEDLDLLAIALRPRAKLEEAEQAVRRSLEIRRRILGAGHPEVATSLNNLAVMLREKGRLEEAESAYRECMRIRRTALAPDHPLVGMTLGNLAILLRQMGRFEEAADAARQALAIQTQVYGEDHPHTIAAAAALGALLQNLARYEEAEDIQRRVLAYWDSHEGRDHPHAVASLNNLAAVLREKGALTEAEALQREACERWSARVGKEHPYYASGLVNLAAVLREGGRIYEAGELLLGALEIRRRLHGDDHPEVASVLYHQATLAVRRRELESAEQLYRRALALRERHLGARSPMTAMAAAGLGEVLRRGGRTAEAAPLLREAFDVLSRTLPPRHPDVERVRLELERTTVPRHGVA